MMMAASGAQTAASGVTKKSRPGPAVFVERTKKQKAKQMLDSQGSPLAKDSGRAGGETQAEEGLGGSGNAHENSEQQQPQQRKLKKPGTSRIKAPAQVDGAPARAPLPASAARPEAENMEKITADMNQWVLNEIGANLQEMEDEKQREASRFRPKPPAQRYFERNPGQQQQQQQHLQPGAGADTAMTDVSDDDDDGDWVIEEYVRIPARAIPVDLSPTDVGVLVLDGEEDDILFFGPEHDDDEDFLEDDEDENGTHDEN